MIKYIIFSCSNPNSTFDIEDLNSVSCEWEVYDSFYQLDKAIARFKLLNSPSSSTRFVLIKREFQVIEIDGQ